MDRTAVVAVSVTVAVIVIAVVGLTLGLTLTTGPDDQRVLILMTAVLAVVGPTILGLLATLKANRVDQELRNGAYELRTVERGTRPRLIGHDEAARLTRQQDRRDHDLPPDPVDAAISDAQLGEAE